MENHRTIYTEVDEEITSIIERIKKTPVAEIALVVPRRSFLSQSIVNLKLLKNQSEKFGKKVLLITRDSLCRSLAEKVGLPTSKKLDAETLKNTRVDTPVQPTRRSIGDLEMQSQAAHAFKKPEIVDLSPQGIHAATHSSLQSSQSSPQPPASHKVPVGLYSRSHDQLPLNPSGPGIPGDQVPEQKETVRITEMRSNPTPTSSSLDMVKPGASRPPIAIHEDRVEIKNYPDAVPPIPVGGQSADEGLKKRVRISDIIQAAFGREGTEEVAEAKVDYSEDEKHNDGNNDNKEEAKSSQKNSPKPNVFTRDVGLKAKPSAQMIGKGEIKKVVLLPRASVRLMWGFLIALVCVAVLTAVFVLPKASVEIIPQKELMVADLEIQSSVDQEELEADKQLISAKEIQETIEEEREFEATGTAAGGSASGNRITGTIAVYNEFSGSTEVFVPKTRFMTGNGLVFRSTTSVKIPGYTKKNGTIVAGRTMITVIADKEGDEYLVEPNQRLTVPGLQGGDRYDKIYAMIEEPLKKPGVAGEKVVSSADIKKAKEEMQKILEEKGKSVLSSRSDGLHAPEETILFEGLKIESSKAAGSTVEKFTLTGEVTAKGVAYNSEDLKKVAETYFSQRAQKDIELIGALNISEQGYRFDRARKAATIEVHAEKEGVKNVDIADFKKHILGLQKEEAQEKLKTLEPVADAEIRLWPFWVKTVPGSEEKIEISVKK